ncbi:MAG: hypothetical protein ABIQ88_02370 [Chitinophagaceae bacterium]
MKGSTIISPERDRGILSRVRTLANDKGIDPSKVQPSYLRIATLLDPSKSTYDFLVRKDVGGSLAHDVKLDQNDSFVMSKMGIMLLGEDPTKPGTGLLQSYPNNLVFAAEAGNVSPLHLNTLYNGSIKVKVDDRVFAEAIPTNPMFAARTTQQASATTFSERFLDDGLIELTPDITLNGSKKNEITLKVPTFAGLQVQYITAATRIYAVFYAKGFLIIGGSNLGGLSNQ